VFPADDTNSNSVVDVPHALIAIFFSMNESGSLDKQFIVKIPIIGTLWTPATGKMTTWRLRELSVFSTHDRDFCRYGSVDDPAIIIFLAMHILCFINKLLLRQCAAIRSIRYPAFPTT
jgi:hypothetical protein